MTDAQKKTASWSKAVRTASIAQVQVAVEEALGMTLHHISVEGNVSVCVDDNEWASHRWLSKTEEELGAVVAELKGPLTRDDMIEIDSLVHQHIVYLLQQREESRRMKRGDYADIYSDLIKKHQELLAKLESITGMA